MVMTVFNHVRGASSRTGRKKIEIKKLEKVSHKQVTFSKRRNGLFKKASEICVLCNAHAAIVVFSPAGKVFCFGQPNVDTVVGHYLRGQASDQSAAGNEGDHRPFSYGELNRQYEDGVEKLEQEKVRLKEMEEYMKTTGTVRNWWCDSINEMGTAELDQYTLCLKELQRNLTERLDELLVATASLLPSSLFYESHGGGLSNRRHYGGETMGLADQDVKFLT